MTTLGQLLRRHRESLGDGATQDFVAKEVGVQKEAVSRWENDHVVDIKAVHLARLANLYGTDARVYLALLVDADDKRK